MQLKLAPSLPPSLPFTIPPFLPASLLITLPQAMAGIAGGLEQVRLQTHDFLLVHSKLTSINFTPQSVLDWNAMFMGLQHITLQASSSLSPP